MLRSAGKAGQAELHRTRRRARQVERAMPRAGSHTLTAEDPLPDDISEVLTAIHQRAH
jgi:hypothetical protein